MNVTRSPSSLHHQATWMPLPSSKFKLTPLSPPKLFSKRTAAQVTCVLIGNQPRRGAIDWTSLSSEINAHLLQSLPTTLPPPVADPMRHLVSATPPSVAPALCLAACDLVGGQRGRAMNTACAIQLMHTAAHIHTQLILDGQGAVDDSVPSMRPGIALMTGVGIMPLGYEMVARSECGDDGHGRIVRVVVEMTRAMGPRGVGEGQLMEAEGRGEEMWQWERKVGRLSACAAACGAIMGGGREEDVEKLRRFGLYVGMIGEITGGAGAGDVDGRRGEAVQVLGSLARLELQGFEQERVGDALGLFLVGVGCKGGGEESRGVI